jgi:pimeloyl-ACP methyl ester carboxylesterase
LFGLVFVCDNGAKNLQDVDYFESGTGPKVVLLHSSASSANQWRTLIENFSDKFNFIALNLIGYGKTPTWKNDHLQSLFDQVALIEKIPTLKDETFSIVGHSFGGSVAMKAAMHFGDRINNLILLEPNPFYLLKQEGRLGAFEEVLLLQHYIKSYFKNDWEKAVSFFANYWNGKGSWEKLSEHQKEKFSIILKPNLFEWGAVMNETTPLEVWQTKLPKKTFLIQARDTVKTIRELNELFILNCPEWTFKTLELGGHMAPTTHPQVVNPLIINSLMRGQKP